VIDRPFGFVSNVKCTRDENGRVTIHWPEGARSTDISREMLDDMVDRLNERLWISVSERLPDEDCRVLGWDGARVSEVHFHSRAKESEQWSSLAGHESPSFWMPLPEPPGW